MSIKAERVDSYENIYVYTLSNSKGMSAKITNFGGTVLTLMVPDKNGKLDDVVMGFNDISNYMEKGPYFGSIIGRVANRIENSSFELNGKIFNLAKNEGNNHLHGGNTGFDKVVWEGKIAERENVECLELMYKSNDGEENYPGNLGVKVTYSITEDNALRIDYYAVSDKDTVVNLTNHSYFNLSGHAHGDILKHELIINADSFTPTDDQCLTTGEIRKVQGTPMDFTVRKAIGTRISSNCRQIEYGNGYDHNFVLNNTGLDVKAAELYDPESGRIMEVYTTKPGIQLYTGNSLNGTEIGKGGVTYKRRGALCLETQYFPNSLKHPNFPSPVLKAGQIYNHTTIYKFLAV